MMFAVAGLVVLLPLYLGFQLGYDQLIVDALGVTGLLAVLVLSTLLVYVSVFLFGISAIASLAVMTARGDANENRCRRGRRGVISDSLLFDYLLI